MIDLSRGFKHLPFSRFTINRQSLQAAGLVGWWPTLASRGTKTLLDLANGDDAAFPGGSLDPVWKGDSERGAVLEFDASNDYINTSSTPRTEDLTEVSITAWVKITTSPSSFHRIIDKGGLQEAKVLMLLADSTLRSRVVYSDTVAISNSNDTVSSDIWHHIGFTYSENGDRKIHLYIDGLEISSYLSQTASIGTLTSDVGKDWDIGGRPGANRAFPGRLDDIRIYNRALSATEIHHFWFPSTRWDLYKPSPRIFTINVPGTISLAGFITPTGNLIKKVEKILSGGITPAGVVANTKIVFQSVAGSLTPAGNLIREAKKLLAGSITPTGALTPFKVFKNLAGSITPTGNLIKKVFKNLTGSITPSGNLIKQANKSLSGSITPTGSLTLKVNKNLAGSITPSGSLATNSVTFLAEPVPTHTLMYVEQVKFTEPYSLQLTGGDDQRLDVFLAQRGLKTTEEIINDLRQDFYNKDRDIVINQDKGQTIRIYSQGGTLSQNFLDQFASIYPPRGEVPVGGVIFWPSESGDIIEFWEVFSPASGKFLVGADGATFINGATGGAETIPIDHIHGPGTLATDSDGHTHGSGTLDTDNDAHTHGSGSLDTDNDSHTHGPGTLDTDNDAHTHGVGSYSMGTASATQVTNVTAGPLVAIDSHIHTPSGASGSDSHDHAIDTGVTASDSHDHAVNTGSTSSDSHDHAVNAGSTSSDSHSHAVDTGDTATALSAVQSILPPFLVGTWIIRIN